MKNIKNIAIIAHVDHGKTTLVDALLKQSGLFRSNEKVEERMMDSNDLEKERGITIFSKNASVRYKDWKINIVDTPGHADFGGEVQRILGMVNSVMLVVDAFEGPMPQTKYVLKKSLEAGLRPIVCINKIDRTNSQPEQVIDMVFDLFVELNATNEQLDFPYIFASAKNGVAHTTLFDESTDMTPLFEAIVKHVPEPDGVDEHPVQLQVSSLEYDNYIGKIATGRVQNGTIKPGDMIALIKRNGTRKDFRITKVFEYQGMKKSEIPFAVAGDIVSVAGVEEADLGDSITDPETPMPLPPIQIDEPTISIEMTVNDSPFFGKEGKFVTSRHIWERLEKEIERNPSLVIERSAGQDAFTIKGRGELQFSILVENMRREGYEFQISRPKVLYKDIDGTRHEPMELAMIDVNEEFQGVVIEKMGVRKGELVNMVQSQGGYTRLEFKVPSRGLIGFRNEFLTDTRGTGILNHLFAGYEPFKGSIPTRTRGVLIAMEAGTSVAYALDSLQERGALFIGPGVSLYGGMIIGEHSRENDLEVNACKGKKLTNMRAAGSDDAVRLTPPRQFNFEQALEYIADDELLEITPTSVRMRKKILDSNDRKKASRSGE